MSLLLQAHHLSVQRGEQRILQDIQVSLSSGECVAIVGPNGAGKSTLLKALAGLISCQQGHVSLNEQDISRQSARWRAQKLAWLAQQSDPSLEMSVREVVALGRLPHRGLLGAWHPCDQIAVTRALDRTGCQPWSHRLFSTLSGGEQQRVLLARALATEAPILLLDEPTTFMDAIHQHKIWQCLRYGAQQGLAIAAVVHDLQLALTADRLWLMHEGRLVAQGQPHDPDMHRMLLQIYQHAFELHWVERPHASSCWVVVPTKKTAPEGAV